MVLTVDFLDSPVVWRLGSDGRESAGSAGDGWTVTDDRLTGGEEPPTAGDWTGTVVEGYRPTLSVVHRSGMRNAEPDAARCRSALTDLRERLRNHGAVCSTELQSRRPGLRFDPQPVLAVDVETPQRVRSVASWVERQGPPGQVPYRAFDVDLSPEFRYCLDRGEPAAPARPPTVLHLGLPRRAAANEDLSQLRVGKRLTVGPDAAAEARRVTEPAGTTTREALETLGNRLTRLDPDVLSVERGSLLPLVAETAAAEGVTLGLPRVPDGWTRAECPRYQQLAGDSSFESYGTRHHSPARYTVPGRAVVDRSNTFFLDETNLAGCLSLVERSGKPIQELSWASIGNVLTAIQIRAARRRDVLAQWRAWRPERFKSAADLHAADRGGTTLSPAVGCHDTVVELDFASLYPNVICRHNLSPETVRCPCHDRADVPELGYAVCDREGFLPAVLQPLVDRRAELKARLAGDVTPTQADRLAGQVDALKWILVSCFGYQGFSNATFGRIEVHEAINAYARQILLRAKRRLEAGGWRVLHGIVDSLWVTPRPGVEQEPLDAVAAAITDAVGIRLEREQAFEWVAFCARRDGEAGALTRYFGRHRDESAYTYRGIECRQRSTPAWIADCQRRLIDRLHETREPAAVIAHLRDALDGLADRQVSPTALIVRRRVRDAYDGRTVTVAALERASAAGFDVRPGQDVRYVVADDDARSADWVRIAAEVDETTRYDADYYRRLAIRAAASVLSPFGWSVHEVRDAVTTGQTVPLGAYSRDG